MARTFLRQDTQVRNSDVYGDAVAPSEAAYETNPTNIETDLNNMRSQLHNLLQDQAGNWWDDLNVPNTLETGLQRGVNDLNTGLHAMEKKRVLRCVQLLADIAVPNSVSAGETLTLTGQPLDTETVTIDTKIYTFQTALTDVDGNVLIGATASDSLDNLIAAMNLAAGAGSTYAASMTAGTYTGAAGAGDTMDILATHGGSHHDGEATTQTLTNGTWGAAVTSGGAGDYVVLAAAALPSQTIAAVGAVTTLGTVVAYEAAFDSHSLVEVVGSHALAPKNLLEIVDGSTGDPILSSEGKRVWGLLQSETVTDAHTITDTTTTRVQISFVHANATNDDLIQADGGDIGGKTVNYCYVERIRLEDFNEQDFLNSAAIDIGAGSATVNRQVSYNNQGTTPVELATNADLDLGTGTEWSIRDNLDADLFQVIEDSAGGGSEVFVASGVDTFRSDAVANDFDNGASFDTGAAGTTINVGVTANQIDSGGALTVASGGAGDLTLTGANSVDITDGFQAASTWGTPLSIADNSGEWDALEVCFPGEPSLAAMLCTALNTASFAKVCANVTSTTAANNDVSNSDGNLDAALGDLTGGTFITDHDIFLNGQLLRSGVDLNADHDVYPGTSLDNTADAQLRFEFVVKNNDVICVISRA
jgi:hypothetical protein